MNVTFDGVLVRTETSVDAWHFVMLPVSYTHLTLPTNREV